MESDTIFKALVDETRRRCLILLLTQGELCVCELEIALEMAQPKVSRHLALLRKDGLVHDRKEGQWVYYSIQNNLPEWLMNILQSTVVATQNSSPYREDIARLLEMDQRPGRCSAPNCSS